MTGVVVAARRSPRASDDPTPRCAPAPAADAAARPSACRGEPTDEPTTTAPLAPPPLVLVDGRMAKRRRTGIGTYIRELRESLDARPASDLRLEWVFGPPALPRLGRLTTLGNLTLDLLWLHVLLPLSAWRCVPARH